MENLLKQVQQNTFQEGPVRLCVRCRNAGLKKETNPRRSPLLCLLGSMPRAVLFLLFYCFASAPWTTLSFSVGGREVVAEPGPTHKVWLRDTGLGSQATGAHPPEEGLDEMPLHQDQSHRVAFWAEGNTVPFPQSARGSRGSRGSDELPQRLLSDLIWDAPHGRCQPQQKDGPSLLHPQHNRRSGEPRPTFRASVDKSWFDVYRL